MLYPVEMSFENARDFTKTKIYFSRAIRSGEEIERFYRDSVLVGGLNGTGKSTLATVFMCLLNAQRDDAAPQDLISTNRLYTPEEPWEFAGKILFYNDGSLEDYSRYIEIEGRFQGYTDRNREVNRVAKKLFIIRESDDLTMWRPYRFSNEGLHKHMPLGQFDDLLEKLGISPKRYLLYWKQGETYKFTKIKDTERFLYFADMMDLTKKILALDKNLLEQANREAELEKLALRLQNQRVDLKKLETDKDRKEERDGRLYTELASYLGRVNALLRFNEEARLQLDETCRMLQSELQHSKETMQELEQETVGLKNRDKAFQEKHTELAKQRRHLEKELEQARERRKAVEAFLEENKKRYNEICDLLDKLKKDDTSVEEIQSSLDRLNGKIASLKVSIKESREQVEKLGHEGITLQTEIEIKEKELEELKQLLVGAELVLKEKSSPERLEEEINRAAGEIKLAEDTLVAEVERKERLLAKLAAYLFLLLNHRGVLEKALVDIEAKLAGLDRLLEEQREEAERLREEKQALKFRMEQEPLADIQKNIDTLEEERQKVSQACRKADQEADKHKETLARLLRLLEPAFPAEEQRYEELRSELGLATGQIKAYRSAQQDKSEELLVVEQQLKKHPVSPEEYRFRLADLAMQVKELVAEHTVLIEEGRRLDLLTENYDRGVYNPAQEKAVAGQSLPVYRFADIFELPSDEITEAKEQEKRLSLIKYAIFAQAGSGEFHPTGEQYHVGLADYAPALLEEPLPFGLKVKMAGGFSPSPSDMVISLDVAARAVTWLKEVALLLTPEGYLKDSVGLRGYDPDEMICFLSQAARENHRFHLVTLRGENAAKTALVDESLIKLENEQSGLQEKYRLLISLLSDRARLSKEIGILSENLSVLQEKAKQLRESVEQAAYRLEVLTRVRAVLDTVKAFLPVEDDLTGIELTVTETERQSFLEHLVKEHSAVISRAERLKKLLGEIEKLRADLQKTTERLQEWSNKRNMYYDLEEQLRVKDVGLKAVDRLIADQRVKIEQLKAEREQHRKSVVQIQSRLEDFHRYFELEAKETSAEIPLFNLLEETARLYEDYRQIINSVDTAIKEWQRRQADAISRKVGLESDLAKVRQAQTNLLKRVDKDNLEKALTITKAELNKVRVSQQFLEKHDIDDKENELKQVEQQADSFRKIVDRHSTVDWNFHALYQEQEEEVGNLTRHYADIMEVDRELGQQLENNDREWQKVQSSLKKLEEEIKDRNTGQALNLSKLAEAEEKLSGYQKDLNSHPGEEESEEKFKDLLLLDTGNITSVSLGEMLPVLRVLYRSKFFEAVEEGWMPSFDDYLAKVAVEEATLINESEYRAGLQSARDALKRIISELKKQVPENASEQYELAYGQYNNLIKEKSQAETVVISMSQTVAEDYKRVEGLVNSSVREVFRNFQQVLDRLGYQAQLNYFNKEQGEGYRRLELRFRKKNEKAFRTVNEHGGLSGGEHAAVSLMLMYSIMVVKENKMGIKSGGYLLLDEWDANLDAINSRQVFEILKKLGKKIISITPRSHSQTYLEEFGVVVRVLQSKGHSIVSILDKQANRVNIEEMFEEMELESV